MKSNFHQDAIPRHIAASLSLICLLGRDQDKQAFQLFKNSTSFQKLLNVNIFCLWKYEQILSRSKSSKIPYCYDINFNLARADIRKSSNRLTGQELIEEMLNMVMTGSYSVDGIGLILTDSTIFAIDLDNCLNRYTQKLTKDTQCIVNLFKDTYIEVSPSGRGLHVFGIGRLTLNGRNKSPKSHRVEAYDSSSIRYITITGHTFNGQLSFHDYTKSFQKTIQSFEENFFPKLTDNRSLTFNFSSTNSKSKTSETSPRDLKSITTSINKSKDSVLFSKLVKRIKIYKSPSEDDLAFCLIIISHTQDYALDAQKEIIKKLILLYRYRKKLERDAYIDKTIFKAWNIFNRRNLQQDDQNKSKLLDHKKLPQVPAKHILKICPLIHSLFSLSCFKYDNTIENCIQHNQSNYIIASSPRTLDVIDLSVYLAILVLIKKQAILFKEQLVSLTNNQFLDLDYYYITVKFSELSKILKQYNVNCFREKIISSIQRLSNVKIKYGKTLTTEGCTMKSETAFLNWSYSYGNSKHLRLGVNYITCIVLLGSSKNYRLLNADVFFQLPSLPLRWLYNYLACNVFPGQDYPFRVSIENLARLMWKSPDNQNKTTQRTRKSKVRLFCQQLQQLQSDLIDFEILLEYSCPKGSTISTVEYLVVKRKRVKLNLSHFEADKSLLSLDGGYKEQQELVKEVFVLDVESRT